jgi:hypothetical protein
MTLSIIREILSQIPIVRHYYCDTGVHAGLYYIKMEGYITTEQMEYLHKGSHPATPSEAKL